MTLPPVTFESEWQQALDRLLVNEKVVTRALDDLAAEHRRGRGLRGVSLSDGSGFITGAALPIDGGYTAQRFSSLVVRLH